MIVCRQKQEPRQGNHRIINILSWKEPIRIMEPSSWPCAGHLKNPMCLRAAEVCLGSQHPWEERHLNQV